MNAQPATAKLSVMVTPAVKAQLEREAAARKTTVGELVRRRIDGDFGNDTKSLVEALHDLAKRAESVFARVDAVHAEVERAGLDYEQRIAAIRRHAAATLDDDARTALGGFLDQARATTREVHS